MFPVSISAQRVFEHVQKLAAIGPREDGTTAYHEAVDYVANVLASFGLDVQRQVQSCWVIEPIETSLEVTKPLETDIKCCHGSLTGITSPQGVCGELAFVDKGFEQDFEGRDLAGKVAIGWQARHWEGAEQPRDKLRRAAERGAVGFVFATKRQDDLITCWSLSRELAEIPFVSISYGDFLSLREKMEQGSVEVVLKVLGEPKQGETANIWAVIQGTEQPDEMIGLGSCHHETVPMNPGANDNASGQAWLLELARFFSNNRQKRSILVMSNCGEETGLWGAGNFVEDNRDWLVKSLKAMAMVDQIGGMDPMVLGAATPWLEGMWVEEAEKLGYRIIRTTDPQVVPQIGFIGDAMPFFEAGIPTAIVGGWPSDFFYHTEADTPDKVCANGIKAIADSAAGLVMRLASK